MDEPIGHPSGWETLAAWCCGEWRELRSRLDTAEVYGPAAAFWYPPPEREWDWTVYPIETFLSDEFTRPHNLRELFIDDRPVAALVNGTAHKIMSPWNGADVQLLERACDGGRITASQIFWEVEVKDKHPKCEACHEFRAAVLFPATRNLAAYLEHIRKERKIQTLVYRLPTGVYDVCRKNPNGSIKEPWAVAVYSAGAWGLR